MSNRMSNIHSYACLSLLNGKYHSVFYLQCPLEYTENCQVSCTQLMVLYKWL